VSDYLVILSVCLTCEYRGINFLKVLLGSEKHHFGFRAKHFPSFRGRAPHISRPSRYTKELAIDEPDLTVNWRERKSWAPFRKIKDGVYRYIPSFQEHLIV
jgi:hypothetical protein